MSSLKEKAERIFGKVFTVNVVQKIQIGATRIGKDMKKIPVGSPQDIANKEILRSPEYRAHLEQMLPDFVKDIPFFADKAVRVATDFVKQMMHPSTIPFPSDITGFETPDEPEIQKMIIESPAFRDIEQRVGDQKGWELVRHAMTMVTRGYHGVFSDKNLKRAVKASKGLSGFIKTVADWSLGMTRVCIHVIVAIVRVVMFVIDEVYRISIPFLSRVFGYSLKVIIPIVAAEIGISLPVVGGMLALSDRQYKNVHFMDPRTRSYYIEQVLKADVLPYTYAEEYDPGNPGSDKSEPDRVGPMWDSMGFPFAKVDGGFHVIDFSSVLGAVMLAIQEEHARRLELEQKYECLQMRVDRICEQLEQESFT